jgi:hypothetical protein
MRPPLEPTMTSNDDERASFWRENWAWVVVPLVVAVAVIGWLLLSGDGTVSPFTYEGY